MSIIAQCETVVLEKKISELLGVLQGRGQTGDFGNALRVEAAQCAWKISEQLGPATFPEAVKKLEKQVLGVLRTKPETNNLEQESESHADFTWLYAAPYAVVGINNEDDQRSAGVDDALVMLSAGQKHPRGGPWEKLGKRGSQHLMRLNRILVSPKTFRGVIKSISDRIGQSRASFARIAVDVRRSAGLSMPRMPAFVRKQLESVASNGKSVLNDQTNRRDLPFIEFGSRAKGVQSNRKMNEDILRGFENTKKTLDAKSKKILAGQTYNWNTGAVFKPTQFEDN